MGMLLVELLGVVRRGQRCIRFRWEQKYITGVGGGEGIFLELGRRTPNPKMVSILLFVSMQLLNNHWRILCGIIEIFLKHE